MKTKKATTEKPVKKRHWAFVLYPESAPSDWFERLQKAGVQCAVSPLHDKDLDPTGEVKKAHWHVILTYGGPTTYNNVKSLTDSLNAPIPQALEQVRGYYRYLTHKDNPEKYQYDENEIKTINGFNIADFVELSKAEVNETMRRLQKLIREKNMTEYAELLDYLQDSELISDHEVASNHTMLFCGYLRSRWYMSERAKTQGSKARNDSETILVDRETGEIIG